MTEYVYHAQEDTAKVVSSMLMVSGVSTLLHTSFGSRLPLIQGASFVYLAPALAITFSPNFVNLPASSVSAAFKDNLVYFIHI